MSDFNTLQKNYSQRVDQAISAFIDELPFSHSKLVEAMRHGTLLGGKRLRPFLVYATGQMLGIKLSDLDAPAAAIECIHAYSLIHDDLPAMDNDNLRRGQPTCHIKYGEAHAILAGDALQTLAFSILANAKMEQVTTENRLKMLSELAIASGAAGMCIGQALDLEAEGKKTNLAALEEIHQHKTGALISSAVRLAAFAAGDKGQQIITILDRYTQAIGLAFQVQDDILDVIGDSHKIGKPQGSDQQQGKSTYPAILGIDQAQQKALDLSQDALNALNELKTMGYDISPLKALTYFIIERDN